MSTPFFRSDTEAEKPAATVVEAPKDLATLTSPEIQRQALEARRRILKAIEQVPQVRMDWRAERIRHIHKMVATDYLKAIDALRGVATSGELQALQNTLTNRLRAGYAKTPNPTRDALWIRLLAEYEIVTDALSENCMWRFQDRLNDLGERVA